MIYLKLPRILGNVKEEKHVGWIELLSMNLGTVRSSGAGTGARRSHQPQFPRVHLSKETDRTSRDIASAILNGLVFDDVKIDLTFKTASGTSGILYTMTKAIPRAYSIGGADGDRFETFVMDFETIRWKKK